MSKVIKKNIFFTELLRCENLLGDFLKEIGNPQVEKLKYDSMINIILVHCANNSGTCIWPNLKELNGILYLNMLCLNR